MAIARFVICLLAVTSAWALPNSRILEGDDANSGQYPWVVSVRVNNAHACCGSIINEKYILTAAHCLSETGTTALPVSVVTVRVGSINQYAGGQIVKAETIDIHGSYGNFMHDIALIQLATPLQWSEKVQKINLPEKGAEIETGTAVTVTGWGLQQSGASPYNLQHTTMTTMSSEDCEYRAGFGYESVVCLDHPEKQGICRGDDGAGVVAGDTLVGVTSFAFGACGTKYPDVATRVPYYVEWIEAIIFINGY